MNWQSLVPLVRLYYELHRVGSPLHPILLDGLVSDQVIEECRLLALEQGDRKGIEVCDALKGLSLEERSLLVKQATWTSR